MANIGLFYTINNNIIHTKLGRALNCMSHCMVNHLLKLEKLFSPNLENVVKHNITTLFHNVVTMSSGVYKYPLSRYKKMLLRLKQNIVTTLSQRYFASWVSSIKYTTYSLLPLHRLWASMQNKGDKRSQIRL